MIDSSVLYGLAAVIAAISTLTGVVLQFVMISRQGDQKVLSQATHDLVNGMSATNREQAGQIGFDAGVQAGAAAERANPMQPKETAQ